MTTNTQLWIDPDSMLYKRIANDTNYLPFKVHDGMIYDWPHITIVTNPAWSMYHQVFQLTNYTLPYYPPSPVYVHPTPPQIIYVTNTIHSSGELQYLAEGAGAGLFLVGLGICVALIMWGLRKLIE